jgi:hypothetical protein
MEVLSNMKKWRPRYLRCTEYNEDTTLFVSSKNKFCLGMLFVLFDIHLISHLVKIMNIIQKKKKDQCTNFTTDANNRRHLDIHYRTDS